MIINAPIKRDILLIGGGHAHVEVLRSFAMRAQPGTRLTLITRDANTPYSGMLPGYLSGHYEFDECHIDLGPLARRAGARFIDTAAIDIDLNADNVLCEGRPPVPFDLLSINTGSTPQMSLISNAGLAAPIKPVNGFLTRWKSIEQRILDCTHDFNLVVIGGGAGGVEVSLCLQHRLTQKLQRNGRANKVHISLVTDSSAVLPQHAAAVRRRMMQTLRARGVAIHTGQRVTGIGEQSIRCESGLELPCDAAVVITNAAAPDWFRDTGLELDALGFIRVTQTLQSISHPRVFAAGDCASFDKPLLKNGVYAVRQGPALAQNLRALANDQRPKPFKPQQRTLALISTGNKNAVVSWGPLALEGPWAWRFKDYIDRRWMRRYQELPEMDADEPMRCGGCGAKVPASVLHNVLGELRREDPDDVPIGLNHPDDAAVTVPPPGQVVLQTVDQFRGFMEDLYLFGVIGANHCLSDIYSMGAQPKHAMAIVTLPYASPRKMEQDLRQLLQGAMQVLDEAGVTLIGGHTGEGSEVAFGLSVTGFADRNTLLHKSGLRVGDALVLTKPLGTGTLLAGDMRGLARSAWVRGAIDAMSQSNGPAAEVLVKHDASACTDITGFGLLGHLGEMLEASDVHARLNSADIPVMPGACELLNDGIASTLHPANEAQAHILTNPSGLSNGAAILCDPQTSGGLLAGVAAQRADEVVDALRTAGYAQAAIIGAVTDDKPGKATIGH